jgi:hypothetical protein
VSIEIIDDDSQPLRLKRAEYERLCDEYKRVCQFYATTPPTFETWARAKLRRAASDVPAERRDFLNHRVPERGL